MRGRSHAVFVLKPSSPLRREFHMSDGKINCVILSACSLHFKTMSTVPLSNARLLTTIIIQAILSICF